MGQAISVVDQCFQPDKNNTNEQSSLPAQNKKEQQQQKQAQKVEQKQDTAIAPKEQPMNKAEAAKPEEPKAEKKVEAKPEEPEQQQQVEEKKEKAAAPAPVEEKAAPAPAAAPATTTSSQDSSSGLKTGCEDYPKASGEFTVPEWEYDEKAKRVKTPNTSSWPAVTNEFVTDGKVVFDKAALSIPGVIPTREQELAELDRAKVVKNDASQYTKDAAEIHENSQPLFKEADEAHKAGDHEKKHAALNKGKAMMEEAKKLREQAQATHKEASNIQWNVAMSMAIKAMYTKEFTYQPHPNKTETFPQQIDYHFFLGDAMEQTIDAAYDLMKLNKFGTKNMLFIPGAGSHSTGPKGCVTIPIYKDFVKRMGFEANEEQITTGSWLLKF